MSDFADYMENAIANVFRGTTLTGVTPYVALFSVMPAEDGTGGTEVTTTIRTAGRLAATFGAPTNGAIANSAAVNFGAAAGSATVVGFALYDAATAGNLLALKAFGASQSVAQNANVSFATGALTLTVQ
jgi:hypothetical protein